MKTCRVCGSTLDEIIKTECIGCPECYNTFKEEFKYIFKKFGIEVKYKGSLPKCVDGACSVLEDKISLQIKLDEAIADEEYEKAALYRDYLRVLNHERDYN